MEDTTGFTVFDRLKIASDSATDAELAVNLNLTKQSIAQARAKKVAPASWVPKAAELFNVSTDWLFFGRGPMRPGEAPHIQEQHDRTQPATLEIVDHCQRCAKLEEKLDRMEEERREVSRENRELSAENRNLWKENSELRERCARLEEQKKACTSADS